jgi:hypothetical protein
MCIPFPKGLDPVTVAGITNPGMSSWVALTRRANFVAGENILILGATGVAGQLAVQVAKRLGAERITAAGRNQETLVRFVQVGESAGRTISLAAASLRSSAVELLGSGFGSASVDEIFQARAEFFQFAATSPLKINVKRVPLRDVETLWHSSEQGARLVFLP